MNEIERRLDAMAADVRRQVDERSDLERAWSQRRGRRGPSRPLMVLGVAAATAALVLGAMVLLGGRGGGDRVVADRPDGERTTLTTTTTSPPAPPTSSAPTSLATTTTVAVGPGPDPGTEGLERPSPGREITFDGVGDLRIGQTLAPEQVDAFEGGSCGYFGGAEPTHDGDQPPTGLVAGADTPSPTIVTIDVTRNATYRTASGVGIGTPLRQLERIYGDRLVVDRADGWDRPTGGLLALYGDVAAVRDGERAITFMLGVADVVDGVKVSAASSWGDDEGCA